MIRSAFRRPACPISSSSAWNRDLSVPSMSASPCARQRPSSAGGMAALNVGDQVLLERPLQVEAGGKAPVAPRSPVVDVLRPGIEDDLPAGVRHKRDLRVGRHAADSLSQLARAWVE